MDAIAAMLTERPYVLAFLASFVVIAWAERGPRRMLFWLASGAFLGWLFEFTSIRTAFPFGAYTYHEALFPDELFIGGVPLFASLSFAFLTYFGYSAACTFLSPLERRGGDVQRLRDPRIDNSLQVLVLAAVITTLIDTVIDPVAHLGRYWFLGDLYAYQDAGLHFDVPLSNYAGWLFVTACIVFINQRFDEALRALEGPRPLGFYLPYKPFWALGSIAGNFGFIVGVTCYLIFADRLPAHVPANDILISALALSGAFIVFAVFMLKRGLERPALAPAY